MTGLGKMTASMFSAANENTLALASLKFDFSLMKVEAPAEFSGLGEALSTRRRRDAEDGTHHKTARRLAALFEQLIPSTPKLITAYGLRSSEIIKTPGINPQSSPKYGPFEAFVGADGTAMWAAATSGVPALGVYLLACRLARAWDAKEAISIWVELVDQRRKEIEDGSRNNHAVSESSRMSLRQEIMRDDLARWDASARAWLRSADQAKVREQTQLTLFIKDSGLPFNGGATTYSKVIEAWQQAMMCIESLLSGRPQVISNRSILVAFSAWHLYPNLIWLGSDVRNVEFNDRYVDPRGIGTVALEPRCANAAHRTSWSLTLSHLRYYGDPITVKSETDFSRVTIQQLHVISLGSIIQAWRVSQRDVMSTVQWFASLWDFLCENASKGSLESLDWLRYLAQAAKEVLLSTTRNEFGNLQLLAYGRRRGKRFLGVSAQPSPPFFGLANATVLAGLSEKVDEERGVAYLRAVAAMSGWRSSDAYICSNPRPLSHHASAHMREYMTAIPHRCKARKRDIDGNTLDATVHARWLHIEEIHSISSDEDNDAVRLALRSRLEYLSCRGEVGITISDVPFEVPGGVFAWSSPPCLFRYEEHSHVPLTDDAEKSPFSCPSIIDNRKPCKCFDCEMTSTGLNASKFEPVLRVGAYRLYLKLRPKWGLREIDDKDLHPTHSLRRLLNSPIEANVISSYLQCLTEPTGNYHQQYDDRGHHDGGNYNNNGDDEVDDDDGNNPVSCDISKKLRGPIHELKQLDINHIQQIANVYQMSKECSWALIALTLATQVYIRLEGATIPLKIVDTALNEAPWLHQHFPRKKGRIFEGTSFRPTRLPATLTRCNTLSCIAHFETGYLLLRAEEFEQTLAIASGNSIFVIGTLISDPFDIDARNVVKRIVGNIGRTGICLLIAPIDPQIRPLGNQYNLVNHATYDGRREDNFRGTSLHLSFTDWTLPLEEKGLGSRTIDQEAYFVESVISVLDSGKWVADLDINCIDFEVVTRFGMTPACPGHPNGHLDYDYTSIDSWEELLDDPSSVGFVRAHGNWAARLAAVSILCQKGQAHSVGILGPESFCLDCLSMVYEHYGGLNQFESPLPSFCID